MIEKYKKKPATEAHYNPIYAAMVENMDTGIGRVLDAVEKNGLSENTLIVFTSDNGGVYHISRQWPLRAGKGSFYEGGIREPFIVYWKGRYEGGITRMEPVSQLDLYPTLTQLAGADPVITPDGEDLLPLLDEGKTDYLNDRALYWHFPAYLEANPDLNEGRDPLFRSRPVSVILCKGWKLIENYEDGVLELYDLKQDVSEKQNVADKYPDKTAQLYEQLNHWKKSTNAPIPTRLNPLYNPKH